MRKILFFIISLTVIAVNISSGVSAAELNEAEADYLARVIAATYPEISFGGRVAVAAVVLNRMDTVGYPDTAGGAVMSIAAEGELGGIVSAAGKIDEKLLRVTKDAVYTAVSGADPTKGAIRFETVKNEGGADLRFDDSTEDKAARENRNYFVEKYGVEAVLIDGMGFWR